MDHDRQASLDVQSYCEGCSTIERIQLLATRRRIHSNLICAGWALRLSERYSFEERRTGINTHLPSGTSSTTTRSSTTHCHSVLD